MDENDLTPLKQAAVQLHELYLAWIEAGFTPLQSLQLVCAVLQRGSSE